MSPLYENYLTGFAPGCVEIFVGFSLLVLLLVGSFKGDDHTRFIGYLSLAVLAMAAALIWFSEGNTEIAFNSLYIRNTFTEFCKIVVLATVAVILGMTLRPLERDHMARFEYPILMLLCALGMMIMISANDLIALYLGLELQSLALYILVAFKRDSSLSSEASIKYFILGALASAFILYGSSFLYGLTGTTELGSLFLLLKSPEFVSSYLIFFGFVLVLAGLVFKLALVPFHMWAPDVYEGSPTPITVLIATAPKMAMISLLMRLFSFTTGNFSILWELTFVILILLSLTIGSFGALFQINVKRLLGYSAMSHMSYALMGFLSKTPYGFESVLIYIIVYIITTLGIFAVLLNLKKNGKAIENMNDFSNLSQEHPLMAAAMTIFLFSLAGIPPLAGFFAKVGVFSAALQQGYYFLVVFGVLMSVVSAAYYLKIIKIMYFENVLPSTLKTHFDGSMLREVYSVMSVSALIILSFGLVQTWLMRALHPAILILFR